MKGEFYTYSRLHLPHWLEVTIPIARTGNVQWIPIRLTCAAIGIDPQKQFAAIHRRYPASVREVPFKTRVGRRDYLALPSDDFALWLATINPARCKLATRPRLEAFIADAKAALSALLFKPDYVPPDPGAQGVLSASSRYEMVFACECGRHWRIVTADGGSYEVERISGDTEGDAGAE